MRHSRSIGRFFDDEAMKAVFPCHLPLRILAPLGPPCLRRGLAAVTLILLTVLPVPPVAGQEDGTIPRVEHIAFTDNFGTDYFSYKLGAVIEVTLTFSEIVAVTGTPQIDLPIESMTRQADYQSGPPSTDLVFRYTVADTDEDTDGLTINANALKLNGGSIKKNNSDIDADLAHDAHSDRWIRAVDGITPVLQTAAVHETHLVLTYNDTLWLYSQTPAGAYGVMVNNAVRNVSAVSISDRAVTLTLASAVTTADQVTVSYTVGTRPLQDYAGNKVAALSDQAVTTSAPYVSSLEISSTPATRQTYAGGEVIEITMTFSENVTVTGTPQLLLMFDSSGSYERVAPYVSGSGTMVLVFRYTVAEGIDRFFAATLRLLGRRSPPVGDEAPDGFSIEADALHMHDGSIRDSDNHDAILILDALTKVEEHKVDGLWPQLVTDDPFVVDGTTLTLRYEEILDENSVPASDAFAVTVGGVSNEVTGVSIDDSTVTLILLTAVGASDEVRLSYTAPTGTEATPIQDAVGNNAQDLTDRLVQEGPPPSGITVSFGAGPYTATEGGTVDFQVTLNIPSQSPVTVEYATVDDTAQAGEDYTATSGILTFASEETTKTVSVPVLNDSMNEGTETFTLQLSNASGATLLDAEATGTIEDDTSDETTGTSGSGNKGTGGSGRSSSSSGGGSSGRSSSSPGGGSSGRSSPGTDSSGSSRDESPIEPKGFLENPGSDSFQSGSGVISGWVCDADTVEIVIDDTGYYVAGYGTERVDTMESCGDTNNGFGLLFNWNLLGDGEHTVVALADGVAFDQATFAVTTLGEEFVTDAVGETVLADFPTAGEAVRLVWQQASQNFVLVPLDREPPPASPPSPANGPTGVLENPDPASFQSGLGLLSGWVCEADVVELEINGGARIAAAYGTARADTASGCGDRDNGFGLLFNWNLLGDGVHTVVAVADGTEFGRATFTVTTLGVEFLQGVQGETVVADFPSLGEEVRLIWQEANQNFVLAPLSENGMGQ